MTSTPSPASATLVRARVVLPVSRPAIDDGAVMIVGNRIHAVGRWKILSRNSPSRVVDLGEVLLLPGLVNAHCHLDYTNMAGQLAPAKKFTDWLKLITASKGGWTYSDFAESWLNGAKMLLRTGTTTVGDIEMVPELLPDVWTSTPLRVFSFLELTGVKSRRPPAEIIQEAVAKIESMSGERCHAGLSPHAPYSTTPELLRLAAQTARRRKLRVVTHVAESEQEFEMFTSGNGEMFHWLKRNLRDMSDCGAGTPVQHLERQGALHPNLLAVHVNYLGPGDAALLARRKVSVVHCPRSHAYFKHQAFPFKELTDAGVNLCLGTDSLASVYKKPRRHVELSMFDEMREFASRMETVPPETILRMATVNGARALGQSKKVGELSPRVFADFIAIPFAGKNSEAYDAVVQHRGNISAGMIDGQWTIDAWNCAF